MNVFAIATSLFAVSSIFSFINARFIKLPGVIGVMVLAMLTALITLFAGKTMPGFSAFIISLSGSIDFSKALLDVMLGFLLFASALHFDINKLKEGIRGVLIISTIGVLLSTLIFAGVLYYVTNWLHIDLPVIYCLLFGALISPTDAVAVAALLKKTRMPKRLETIISGESLFNDGIGLVLFITFLEIANTPDKGFSIAEAGKLFAHEVFGGLALGAGFGWLAYRMMRAIDDFQTIVLISITLVMVITAVGAALHVSIPLAEVAAGLLVGSRSFSKRTDFKVEEVLGKIWGLMDDVLNTILFVMIGLQMVTITFSDNYILIGVIGILALLLARALSIFLPVVFLRRSLNMEYNSILILTWGGLRGGISVALALSLPGSPYRELILAGSFFIVVFSVVVQGLTLNKVVNKLVEV
ncbi:sodium:proton antiporter [Mucilaginibacter pallidiroseus]|uniref:Sodium:proton antiporter n=1 Tax=Mucilaginibacter pallidiroseus TaxID=2599295 RepID=A0A563UHV3_9SPHI|nr:cation:proton antiporter [Mucilaginibacter pallidiroseus]TWR30964.1 sodium:proton antiporter [Mucilaginibacter pallidiroseus]